MKIAVLMGGNSEEKEVSRKTGLAVYSELKQLNFNVFIIEFGNKIDEIIPKLIDVDLVFNALHGGVGENGIVQGFLDCLNISYTGSGVLASSICMNKHLTKTIIDYLGYKTPKWQKINRNGIIPEINQFPVIVKPNSQGSTLGLSLVKNFRQLRKAMEEAFKFDDEVLVEEFIFGRELTVSIVEDDTLPIVEIFPKNELYDYECKYLKGNSTYLCSPELPLGLSEKVIKISNHIYNKLGCSNYGRIDFLLDNDNVPWFLEVNTLPGMTETSLLPMAARSIGLSFSELIKKIIFGIKKK